MTKKPLFFLLSFAVAAPLAGFVAQQAIAQNTPGGTPSVIGTIDVAPTVTGANGTCAPTPLAKMGIVPLITTDSSDALVRLVVHRDMELAGVYDVLDDANAPSGPYTRNTGIDLKAWRRKGDVDWIVRVYANTAPDKVELTGEGWQTPTKDEAGPAPDGGDDANNPPPNAPKPLFSYKASSTNDPKAIRLAAHQLTDQLLRGITGTSGSFASQLTYSGPVGQSTHQQAFIIDADGFALHGYGPANWTTLSPTFGPNHELFYALSQGFSRYNIVHGMNAAPVPLGVRGSQMNIAFNRDKTKMAFDVFEGGDSKVYVADADGKNAHQVSREPLAHSPAFGPNDMLAYVAGNYAQQVIVNGKPVSPAGAWAAAPTICDTPDGVLVVYSVGFGAGSSLVATDPDGSRVHQLVTSNGGGYPACSPDGRLVAYFSYQNRGQGPGLYVTPIAHPCNGKRIGTSTGESLRWEKIGASGPM